MNRPYVLAGLIALLSLIVLHPSCKKTEKPAEEVLALSSFPFARGQAPVREFFEKAGWKVVEETPEKSTFAFPAAVPEELKKMPVMGGQGNAPEPYTIQVFFNHGNAAIAILHRFDQTERLKGFVERLSQEYGLPAMPMSEKSEKTPAGNILTESKGAGQTSDYVFLMFRSSVRPEEEKLKDGMNDEVELRIFPKKLNEGISPEALLKE